MTMSKKRQRRLTEKQKRDNKTMRLKALAGTPIDRLEEICTRLEENKAKEQADQLRRIIARLVEWKGRDCGKEEEDY